MSQGETLILTAALTSRGEKRVRDRFRAGELVKLRPGVYYPAAAFRHATPEEKYRLQCFAAAVTRPAFVLVGKSSAAAWKIPFGTVPKYVEQARIRGTASASVRGVRIRELAVVPGQEIRQYAEPYERAKITGLPQTLVDLGRWHGVADGVVATDYCLRQKLVARADLQVVLDAIKGRHGRRDAAQAVRLSHDAAESPRESLLRIRIWQAGFPAPHVQAVIRDSRGTLLGRVDLFYPEYSLAVEYDGEGKYFGEFGVSPQEAARDELRRQKELLNAGIRMVRVGRETYRDGSWRDDLGREIELGKRIRTVFPEHQWSSAGLAW